MGFSNDITKERETPGWTSSLANTTTSVANSVTDGTNKIQDSIDNTAASLGIPNAFLSTENTNRRSTDNPLGLSAAAQDLYDTLDKTAQRTYIGDGFANKEKNKPNIRSVITQTPEAIVLIKKKFVSTLNDNFFGSAEMFNNEEIHFMRASKKLFQNKCEEISNYEKITKINKIVKNTGVVTSAIAQAIFSVISSIEQSDFNQALTGTGYNQDIASTSVLGVGFDFHSGIIPADIVKQIKSNASVIKQIKSVLMLNGFNELTTWISTTNGKTAPSTGDGTGVIELTTVTSINCDNGISLEDGSCNFSITDPYHLFWISEYDIERAIFESSVKKFSIFNITASMLESEIKDNQSEVNTLRNGHAASTLSFQTDETTKVYNKVIIVLDKFGIQVTNDDGSFIDGYQEFNKAKLHGYPKSEYFTKDEYDIVKRIHKSMLRVMQLRISDYDDYRNYNINSNYVRKLMRMYYLGRQIIQPQDSVTVFINSQTQEDKMILGGLGQTFYDYTDPISGNRYRNIPKGLCLMKNVANMYGSSNFASLLNKVVGQFKSSGDSIFLKDEALKNTIVGSDFPIWLWNVLRSNFTSNDFGTCTFSGVVISANENHSDGSYKIDINCRNNAYFFEQGYINTKPGVYQFNGYLYDPLTPFDFEFDESNGLPPDVSKYKLLPENVSLLESNSIRMQDGKNFGQIANVTNYNDTNLDPNKYLSTLAATFSNLANKVYTAPDGFKYRWKKGIGTAIVNQSGTRDGLMSSKLIQENVAQVQMEDPFGGQDMVNVISILVCGEPYNFNTFYNAASKVGTITAQSNYNPDTDYFQGLFKRIKKQNKIWGDFIPFKKMTTDSETFAQQMALQTLYSTRSSAIKKMQRERDTLINKLMQLESSNRAFDPSLLQGIVPEQGKPSEPVDVYVTNLGIEQPIVKRIAELDAQIQLQSQLLKETLTNDVYSRTVIAAGNSLYFNEGDSIVKSDGKNQAKLKLAEQNEICKRRLWQVKGNIDKNLFIVGSEYDSDYDLQTIGQNLTNNFSFVNVSWKKVKEQIQTAVAPLGMEIFANSQGHIELRCPKYNKIPSSVLASMIRNKSEKGIQIYPAFIESMMKSRIEATFEEIETIEDQIRLYVTALGASTNDYSNLLNGVAGKNPNNSKFVFATDDDGTLKDLRDAVNQIDTTYSNTKPDDYLVVEMTPEIQSFFKRNESSTAVQRFVNATNNKFSFDTSTQVSNYKKVYSNYNGINEIVNIENTSTLDAIRQRLAKKSNRNIESIPTIEQLLPNTVNGKISPIDIDNIQNKISSLITRRFEALTTAVNLIKNFDDSMSTTAPNSNTLTKMLFPNLLGTNGVPEFLMDLVEDETYDDYGPNSGQRFVIKEKQIITASFREEAPDFVSIELSGSELNELVGGRGFSIGDLKLANVQAVDYDLWRQYGYTSTTEKHIPFLSNPELQLAPYAHFLLNQQRAKILTASITVVGNEYYQPGEVYYLEERGLLYYCTKVSHSFSYGGQFQTMLELKYGHAPGEYIPTPLDIIGKNLFNGVYANIGNYRVARSGTTGNSLGTHLGTLVADGNPNATDPQLSLFGGSFKDDTNVKNLNTIKDIIGKVMFLANTSLPTNTSKLQGITIRIYGDFDSSDNLPKIADYVAKTLIQGDQEYKIPGVLPKEKIIGGTVSSDETTYSFGNCLKVDFPKEGKTSSKVRNPSDLAWSLTDDILKQIKYNPLSDDKTEKENQIMQQKKSIMSRQIIDIWIEDDIIVTQALADTAMNALNNGSTTKPSDISQNSDLYKAYLTIQQNANNNGYYKVRQRVV